jgi:hypothetical protein
MGHKSKNNKTTSTTNGNGNKQQLPAASQPTQTKTNGGSTSDKDSTSNKSVLSKEGSNGTLPHEKGDKSQKHSENGDGGISSGKNRNNKKFVCLRFYVLPSRLKM